MVKHLWLEQIYPPAPAAAAAGGERRRKEVLCTSVLADGSIRCKGIIPIMTSKYNLG